MNTIKKSWVLALLMALMGLLTNFVSNNASAAIGTPLGVELARSLGVAPEASIFLDDIGATLKAARALGMHTIKVDSAEQAIAELEAALGFPLG